MFFQITNVYDYSINLSFKQSINRSSDIWYKKIIFIKGDGNFISSMRESGFTEHDVSVITQALQWQLDVYNLHQGDRFLVLMSRKRFEKKKNYSVLLGMRLCTGGKDYYAFRADDGNFYNLDAIRFCGIFIRYPIKEKFRVSSTFNMKRLNPVTGHISPHRGVDFAVPIGTPVITVGDGEVVISKYGGVTTGNYIAIRHGCECVTRYMHLKKNLVKIGQKVRKGDYIALSGNTGRTTGPHLHFEIWINKRAVNPLTIKLLHYGSLNGSARVVYLAKVEQILPQLQFN
ncbi:murein DD-endopeptidase MepM [Blochmannia endosymbiont of Camponotus (Colobopsis) obliquus]|uniref:murein DD-endopeptidase MepM n=1 Tax=Blochmannia endosymbiont of Camponotus (Colobopsis) obliquus TaxID=1505597 RepID=UPI001EEE553D|nr:murein DD-endopeptidase MepM [Blochmannia endosymbiont of Camponotus (Colobopsis) obliquus]